MCLSSNKILLQKHQRIEERVWENWQFTFIASLSFIWLLGFQTKQSKCKAIHGAKNFLYVHWFSYFLFCSQSPKCRYGDCFNELLLPSSHYYENCSHLVNRFCFVMQSRQHQSLQIEGLKILQRVTNTAYGSSQFPIYVLENKQKILWMKLYFREKDEIKLG